MPRLVQLLVWSLMAAAPLAARAQSVAPPPAVAADPALARSLGADERGMRNYVLVILKTGPKRMPDGEARKEMFKGHFANIQRMADEKKLALAGPFDGIDGWRGMYVFATDNIAQARSWVESDPVLVNGEMVPEFHKLYASAALMMVGDVHKKIAK